MKRKGGGTVMITRVLILVVVLATNLCDGARRQAQRRQDPPSLLSPPPSAETLQALAQAMGAAEFEHATEGRLLVKRLIPNTSQPDLDVVEHQGVIGRAGVDFPAFPSIPTTGFNCKNAPTGYYADLETDCQVFHICDTSRKISFLCPNGTIFSQSHLICDWWFKVDCASSPALYESSAEYYSNEQKKTKLNQNNYKADLQPIGTDNNIRAEPRRTTTLDIPTTTERFLRHKQRLHTVQSLTPKSTARSFQTLLTEQVYPTQRFQGPAPVERKRKTLVQISNFNNAPTKTTQPTYAEPPAFKTAPVAPGDYNSLKEMQVAAETASFTNNNNRQYLQDLNNKNLRPYPVYTPNVQPKQATKTNPTLTTLYDINAFKNKKEQLEITTKRSTLVPYTKAYSTIAKEPYTRPGISLLRNYLEKEKNRTTTTTTTEAPIPRATQRSDVYQVKPRKVTIANKDSYETATKIPLTTRPDFTASASSAKYEVFSPTPATTEPNYKERRERLMRKLNFGDFATEPSSPDIDSEKFYGDQPNRPGLVVPPSLTPKTLHTLAIYYATALDNLSTTETPTESSETTVNYEDYAAAYENLGGLFSPHTVNKYTHLFGQGTENPEALEDIKMDPNVTYNEILDDLTVQQSQNPFATSPQIRELAQVFTHALSAYLQDPVQFRKVLSDIRPTQPSFGELFTTEDAANTEPTTTVNEEDDEILGFSDDNKLRNPLVALREAKQLNFGADYPTTVQDVVTTTPKVTVPEIINTTPVLTTTRRPYICCGRISASYTSPTIPRQHSTTQIPFTNTVASNVNTLSNSETTTEDSYNVPRYGGFQNNTVNDYSPYGKDAGRPLSDYVASTNLPTAWGVDSTAPVTDTDTNIFESKKLRTTTGSPITTTPIYFTETDASIELENEEELQRAQSHSFVSPQKNSIRHGKQLSTEVTATTVRKPSEELEAPTLPDFDSTTVNTTPQPTTYKPETFDSQTTISSLPTSYFTSPDTERSTNDFQWPSTLQNWQSTILDPITLNDNLSPESLRQNAEQSTTTPTVSYGTTIEPVASTTYDVEVAASTPKHEDRVGRLLRDPTSTEPAQDVTTIADAFVEKAKEIMGGMNATTTQKLMNVMKKTKSKTVKRLILLLVQTCDDDHNSTAEASKKALLEALMAVSQKDMDEIAKVEASSEGPTPEPEDESNYVRRTDQVLARQQVSSKSDRRGKSLNFDASAINSLSATTERQKSTTELATEAVSSTTPTPVRTTITSRRGAKKFLSRASAVEVQAIKEVLPDSPIAAARVAAPEELKTTDTRALELLRSLYTIASRWG